MEAAHFMMIGAKNNWPEMVKIRSIITGKIREKKDADAELLVPDNGPRTEYI